MFKKIFVLAPPTDVGEFGCGGTVSRLIDQYDCGRVIDPDGNEPLDRERDFLDDIGHLRVNGLEVARSVLSLGACSEGWSKSIMGALAGH